MHLAKVKKGDTVYTRDDISRKIRTYPVTRTTKTQVVISMGAGEVKISRSNGYRVGEASSYNPSKYFLANAETSQEYELQTKLDEIKAMFVGMMYRSIDPQLVSAVHKTMKDVGQW